MRNDRSIRFFNAVLRFFPLKLWKIFDFKLKVAKKFILAILHRKTFENFQ